jgi:hypothetical protein
MTKIVINSCYGGFSLSAEGMKRYAEIKGLPLYKEGDDFCPIFWTIPPEERTGLIDQSNWLTFTDEERRQSNELFSQYTISSTDFDRTDPILVQVVEELGSKADGSCAELTIETLKKGTLYRIAEYDGYESIETNNDIAWSVA